MFLNILSAHFRKGTGLQINGFVWALECFNLLCFCLSFSDGFQGHLCPSSFCVCVIVTSQGHHVKYAVNMAFSNLKLNI